MVSDIEHFVARRNELREIHKALSGDGSRHTVVRVVQNLGLLYYSCGKLDEAETMLKRTLAGYEKALEPEHLDTLRVVQNLGLLYHSRGKLDEAETMWKRALAGFEKALGPEHQNTLNLLQSLGVLYHGRGKFSEAEAMWKRALAGCEKALGLEHQKTLEVVQNLGMLYHGRGKLSEAEQAGYEKALGLAPGIMIGNVVGCIIGISLLLWGLFYVR